MKKMVRHDFLVEIHTAELPPKALPLLAQHFLADIQSRLTKLDLAFADASVYATPRRLAVLVKKLAEKQSDSVVERKGPALAAAYDHEGKPTAPCVGFARSCGVSPEQLMTIKTAQGEWVGFQQYVAGKTVHELLPTVVQQSLAALPIPKRMRWGNHTAEFVRPVHSVMMLYGKEVIEADILGCRTGRLTRGHRFHSKGWISIASPSRYVKMLENKSVIVDFERRKQMILEQTNALVKKTVGDAAHAVISDELLNEVACLVEWPVAVCGSFDRNFLRVPQEALMSAMQDHQRYFPLVDDAGKLLPNFVTISNIESADESQVIAGNERVLRARLSDAAFFYETDKKIRLADRVDKLKEIVFQAKLGTLFDKSERVALLAEHIAKQIQANPAHAKRAALLSKTDLTTEMVGEFPELQGLMGRYYALNDAEPMAVANAINEHYMPRFSGDALPATLEGAALAIADRIDTLVGVFGINQAPTGDKDPFALRRAALGVLRIMIEKKLNLDLRELLACARKNYAVSLENQDVETQALDFMLERLRPWYLDQSITPDVFASVAALGLACPYDIHRRIQAVQHFRQLPEAASLSIANKRVSNILAKSDSAISAEHLNDNLFDHDAEKTLAHFLMQKRAEVASLSQKGRYTEALEELAELRSPVDDFFDHVMVNVEDQPKRENRLLMLKQLRELFLHVADIALLQ